MRPGDAIRILAGSNLTGAGPETWADLGCGEGTFTIALARTVPSGSLVHAVDRDCRALRTLPPLLGDVRIATHCADFTALPWPFESVDGVLMANALHFVADQSRFLESCAAQMRRPLRFLIVEYDTEAANRWVPFPVSLARLPSLFESVAPVAVRELGSRPSVYHRARLYGALITEDR
jgi:ubiquinone/menaquinone biosynthesis C-methylase UbiE